MLANPFIRAYFPVSSAKSWIGPPLSKKETGVRPSCLWRQLGQSVMRFRRSKGAPPAAMGWRWWTSSFPLEPQAVQRRPSRRSTAARLRCHLAVERMSTPGSPAARGCRDRSRSHLRHGPRFPSAASRWWPRTWGTSEGSSRLGPFVARVGHCGRRKVNRGTDVQDHGSAFRFIRHERKVSP
jgi:hypothetical protein